jgi:hypothetical protein
LQFNALTSEKNYLRQFSILHINDRSLVKNIDKTLDLINSVNHKFTVIAVTETWADKSIEDLLDIDGYNKIMNHRSGKGGGVAIYIDSDLSFSTDKEPDNVDNRAFESIFANVNINLKVSVTVGAIYRPPSEDIHLFNHSFEAMLGKLGNKKNKCFLAGDFNINLLCHENHTETGNFLNLLFQSSYYRLITRPTRYSKKGSTLIDNIFTNFVEENNLTGILVSDVSDHIPVFCIINKELESKGSQFNTKNIRIIDETKMSQLLSRLDETHWDFDWENVNESYTNFADRFLSAYNECLPVVNKQIKVYRNSRKPWITSALITSIKKKNKLYRAWLCSRNEVDLIWYKKYKNKLSKLLRTSEKIIIKIASWK